LTIADCFMDQRRRHGGVDTARKSRNHQAVIADLLADAGNLFTDYCFGGPVAPAITDGE
jgi:hypothetical protein